MRHYFLALGILACASPLTQVAFSQQASPTPAHREAVRRLIEVTRVRELMEESTQTMLKGQLEQMPQLAPVANILEDFYREQLAWSVVEPDFTRIYLDVFTEREVRDLIAFYQTPLGQAMLAKMPVLMAKSNELTARRIQAAMPQLMQRLQAAMQGAGATPADTSRPRRP